MTWILAPSAFSDGLSPKDSSAAAGSAGESDHAELALRLAVRNPRHEPVAAVAMIGFTR